MKRHRTVHGHRPEFAQTSVRWLNLVWVVFSLSVGGANLYVMSHFDRDTRGNFKVFGIFGLTVVIMVIQTLCLSRYMTV